VAPAVALLTCGSVRAARFDAQRPPSRQRRTEVQMQAAGQNELEGRELLAERLGHPFLPTCPPLKRRVERPSTPKGVGRVAPLTATRHDAKSAGMSADQGRHSVAGEGFGETAGLAGPGSGYGQGYGQGCELHVRTNLALRCGWRRPPAADHPQSPLTLNMSGNWWWSAAGGLVFGGGPSWCGRGLAAGAGGDREGSGECGGWGRGEPKLGRNECVLRLVGGWWS
jgi:hypothetical protein